MKRGFKDTMDPTEEQTDKTKRFKKGKARKMKNNSEDSPRLPQVISPNNPAKQWMSDEEETNDDKEGSKTDQSSLETEESSEGEHEREEGDLTIESKLLRDIFLRDVERLRREEELRIEAEYSDEIDFFRSPQYPPNFQKPQPTDKQDSDSRTATAVDANQAADQPESSRKNNSDEAGEKQEKHEVSEDEFEYRSQSDLTPQELSYEAFDFDPHSKPIPLLTPPSEELPENYQPVRREPPGRTLADLLFASTFGLSDIDSFYEGFEECCPNYAAIVAHNVRKREERYRVPTDYINGVAGFTTKKRMYLANIIYRTLSDVSAQAETFNLAMNIVDRFLATQTSFKSDKLYTLAITTAHLATKFEQRRHVALENFGRIRLHEALAMESDIISALNLDIAAPTTPAFILRYLLAVGLEGHPSAEELAIFLGDLAVSEYKMIKYQYSLIATAAVYLVHCVYEEKADYPENLAAHSKYTYEEMKQCADDILDLLAITDSSSRLRPRDKYETLPVEIVLKLQKEFREEIATLEDIATGSLGPTFGKTWI